MLMKTRPRDDGGEGGGYEPKAGPTMTPFRVHRKRCGPPSYHRRVQKKWVKRWGELPTFVRHGRKLKYILQGTKVIPARDLWTWGLFMNRPGVCILALAQVGTGVVSTVFLGLDNSFSESGPPVVFETMVRTPTGDVDTITRYASYAEAAAGHVALVAAEKAKRPDDTVAHIRMPKGYSHG